MLKTLIESIMRLIPDLMPQDLSTIIWGILGPEKSKRNGETASLTDLECELWATGMIKKHMRKAEV